MLFSYQRGFCDPLDTPVQDGSGAVWANHDSDDGAYKQLSFQSILGVGYRIEKSNNLVNWTNFAQFYGVGNTVTWNLFANPVPEDQNGGGNQAPVEEDTRKSATLVMNKADTGELVLGWTSLDTAEAVQHVLTGLSIADEWNTNPIVGHSTDDYHFTMILMTGYNGVIPQNSQLGALDTAMISDISSNFATINQSVIDNAAASQLAPPPLPPDPSSKVFFRLAINAKLDSDFDGIPDVLEYQNGNSSSFSHDSDGDGASDGSEADQGTNPNDANDKPEIEALIVTGNAEAGVEISQKRKIIIPAGSPNRLIVVALQSDEYPSYTSGDLCEGECPFNDQLRWLITLSNGETISGQVDVNDLHEKWETESDTFLGRSPVYFQEVKVVESKPDQDVVVEVEVGATNIEDGALPSTVMVGLLPVEVVVPKLNAQGAEIAGELVSAKDLKIAKMRGGTLIDPGPNALSGEYRISEDEDRFYVRIPGLPENSEASIMLQTGHALKPEYRDSKTEIELKYDQAKKLFTTKSMVLVSDDLDDAHSQNLAGEDNDMFVDEFKGDRSHKAALGGLVRIASIKLNGTEHDLNLDLPVTARKQVTVKIWRIKKHNQNLPYVAEAIVNEHIKVLKERYAQIGLEVNVVGPLIKEIPSSINLDDGYQIQDLGTPGTVDEEENFLAAVATENDADIEIFYVPNITDISDPNQDSAAGYSYVPSTLGAGRKKIHNNIVMSGDAKRYVLAHELGHILLNSGTHNYPSYHLMGLTVNEIHADDFINAKRLLAAEENTIHQHPQVKNAP